MTPETRKWLMLWTLNGRPPFLPPARFATMPEEIFDYLPTVPPGGLVMYDGCGFSVHNHEGEGFEQRIAAVYKAGPGLFQHPSVSITQLRPSGTSRKSRVRYRTGVVVGVGYKKPGPSWRQPQYHCNYSEAMEDAQEKLRQVLTRPKRKRDER